jgi:hypothetical protein
MSVKLALLKSGENVIADIKELISDDKICGYLFTNPQKIKLSETMYIGEEPPELDSVGVTFSPWIVFSNDKEIAVRPDWIVTVVDPVKDIIKLYTEHVNGTDSEVSSTEE